MSETKITATELLSGDIRNRQGGDPDDFTVAGTTNYSEDKKDMMKQIGVSTSALTPVTVTFPVPFSQPPIVLMTPIGSAAVMPQITTSPTTTSFSFQTTNILGALLASNKVNWSAEGRR